MFVILRSLGWRTAFGVASTLCKWLDCLLDAIVGYSIVRGYRSDRKKFDESNDDQFAAHVVHVHAIFNKEEYGAPSWKDFIVR